MALSSVNIGDVIRQNVGTALTGTVTSAVMQAPGIAAYCLCDVQRSILPPIVSHGVQFSLAICDLVPAPPMDPAPNEFALSTEPAWFKAGSLTYEDFAAAALTNTIPLFELPQSAAISQFKVQASEAFGGGGITGYTVSITDDTNVYTDPFDVYQAPGPSVLQLTNGGGVSSAATPILITATATGADLNVATTGSVDIWSQLSSLPA